MLTKTPPKRQRLPEPERLDDEFPRQAQTVERQIAPTDPPPASPPRTPAGPSWREFLLAQGGMVLAMTLVFGLIAYSVIVGAVRSDGPAAPAAGGAAPAPGAAQGPAPAPVPANVARLPQPPVAAPLGQRAPTTVTVELETREIVATLDDGVAYQYWTFNGTVPGPMIRVRQGDTVELTLTNAPTSKAPHNIDLHAVTGPGGGGEVTVVAPGERKTFRFRALNPGVYVYHCATPPVPHHIASGMYGLIVVEPPQGLPAVDREFYVMQGDFYLQGERGSKGQRAYATEKMLAEQPEYVVFNGAVGALTGDTALKARVGETVRIYFGVGGPNVTSSFHVIGEVFDRVAVEGASLEDQSKWLTNVQSTGVPTGGATVVEFKVDVPGKYALVDHSLGRAGKGAVGILEVEGPENPDVFQPVR